MNYLPLLLLAIPLLTKKENAYKEILSAITVEDLLTVLPLLGIKEEHTHAITKILPSILSDEVNLALLLKEMLPLFLSNISTQKSSEPFENINSEPLEPVSSFINEEISNSLRAYFS